MEDALDEHMFGAIIRSMLDVARNSENHMWFLEKEDFASGEFTDADWWRFLADTAWTASQYPAMHIDLIIEIPTPDWRDAHDYAAAFYEEFLHLFDEQPSDEPDIKASSYVSWRTPKHRHTPFFLSLPFPLMLIYLRKRP